MAEIIGVRFKNVGKVYHFDPNGLKASAGQEVIVETARGIECGTVVFGNREMPDEDITSPLKQVLRFATAEDRAVVEQNRKKEQEALQICQQKIDKHKLEMKLVDVEYALDGSKILFYFTADGRVDFRELVKDLASVFHTRIELRQIGIRDESKMLGGLGICGRPFCCSTFLGDFQSVSMKMAKEQGLALNPTKISGTCGRLMCCLKYEQDAYEELLRMTPRNGSLVKTSEGRGVVIGSNLLTGELTVRLDMNPDVPQKFNKKDVSLLKGSGHKGQNADSPEDTAVEDASAAEEAELS